jgi:hypothetical protein
LQENLKQMMIGSGIFGLPRVGPMLTLFSLAETPGAANRRVMGAYARSSHAAILGNARGFSNVWAKPVRQS